MIHDLPLFWVDDPRTAYRTPKKMSPSQVVRLRMIFQENETPANCTTLSVVHHSTFYQEQTLPYYLLYSIENHAMKEEPTHHYFPRTQLVMVSPRRLAGVVCRGTFVADTHTHTVRIRTMEVQVHAPWKAPTVRELRDGPSSRGMRRGGDVSFLFRPLSMKVVQRSSNQPQITPP